MSEQKYTVGRITNLTQPEKIIPLDELGKNFNDALRNFKINMPQIITVNPDSIKGRIFEYFNKQTEKGVQKYGHTLDDCPDDKFDWKSMIIEELVDCIQYQQKEIVRLERENAELKTYVNNLISDKAFLEKLLNPSDGEN